MSDLTVEDWDERIEASSGLGDNDYTQHLVMMREFARLHEKIDAAARKGLKAASLIERQAKTIRTLSAMLDNCQRDREELYDTVVRPDDKINRRRAKAIERMARRVGTSTEADKVDEETFFGMETPDKIK